ncbi:MAG: pilus assembly protein [Pirellulaceae bacterium]
MSRRYSSLRRRLNRRGAVTVEFAIIAPVLLTMVLGVIEAGRLFETQNILATAAREGARLAAMDREGVVQEGQSTNDKIEQDVKNFLAAQGYNADDINVNIVSADSDEPFDLDADENSLELFKLRVEIPYSHFTETYAPGGEEFSLGSEIVFRNARTSLAQ